MVRLFEKSRRSHNKQQRTEITAANSVFGQFDNILTLRTLVITVELGVVFVSRMPTFLNTQVWTEHVVLLR